MNNYVHGGAAAPVKTKRVFLRTGTANEGYAVCYNWDEVANGTEGDSVTSTRAALTAAGWNDARRTQVEAPSEKNNLHFAGVVDAASHGVVGPNWITVHEPGSVCNVYTGVAVSVGVSSEDGNQGTTRTFTVAVDSLLAAGTANGQFNYTGLPGCGAVILLAEGAASVPNDSYLKMAMLQDGKPSGGVYTNTQISTATGASAVIMHGVIDLAQRVATEVEAVSTLSIASGDFIGQEIMVLGGTAASSLAITVDFGGVGTCAALSLEYLTTGTISCAGASISAPANWVHAKWNGKAWECKTANAAGWNG